MSACGTVATILNYVIMIVLTLATIGDAITKENVTEWRRNVARAALIFAGLWFAISILQVTGNLEK